MRRLALCCASFIALAACSDGSNAEAWEKRKLANQYHPPGGDGCVLLTGTRFCGETPTGPLGSMDAPAAKAIGAERRAPN